MEKELQTGSDTARGDSEGGRDGQDVSEMLYLVTAITLNLEMYTFGNPAL